MNEQVDIRFVDECIAQIGTSNDRVLEILQAIQSHYGYLPNECLGRVCEITEITPATITGVSTFYDHFRHRPAGKHRIHVCVGTACHVKGAERVYDAFKRYLDIPDGEDTDSDGLFTLEKVACLGCCTLAPAVQIDQATYGHLTADKIEPVIQDFLASGGDSGQKPTGDLLRKDRGSVDGEIRIGLGSCCMARGSAKVRQALDETIADSDLNVAVKRVGCVGMCSQTPLLEIVRPDTEPVLYTQVAAEEVKPIVTRHFRPASPAKKMFNRISAFFDDLLTDNLGQELKRYPVDVRDPVIHDFLNHQVHIATESCGVIDPVDLDEYMAKGGYTALRKCMEQMSRDEIIENVTTSGLRGRGGAGFPTHLKWKAVASSNSDIRYIVCNGDEGDPGAFMDRMLMESYPFRILEGISIAAYAVGANQGYLYIRSEYPLAVQRISEAMEKCREAKLFGKDIMGHGFDFDLKIVPGAGAFVCGEETALLASIEGRRGMPRFRPPYPAESGLWGKPTLINNVETYADVPWIIRSGGKAFSGLGTADSKGTKVFALAGKVKWGGLIEVPMGITIRQIVEGIGGGIGGDLKFKAVQIGGPSGGCIPAEHSDIPVDYESLTHSGAIMGSGGLVVLDETDCMVDIARYFLEFTQDQSCGRCTFCRIGTRRMLEVLERLCNGEGKQGDIEELERLADMIKKASLCGLGKTAPNPVLTTIQYFREEYEAHIQGRCPAGKCKALITYRITDDCIGCTLCAQHCPVGAIEMKPYEVHEIDTEKCVRCDTCRKICPENTVEIE